LLAHGINAGEITYPEYLPQGEFRVAGRLHADDRAERADDTVKRSVYSR